MKVPSISNPLASIETMFCAYTEYLKVAEQEKTKRREINAEEKTQLAKIKATRDALITYLDKSFDERKHNFQLLFNQLDKAMENGENQQVAFLLESIVQLGKSSPFQDLADTAKVKGYIEDPNHVWEI